MPTMYVTGATVKLDITLKAPVAVGQTLMVMGRVLERTATKGGKFKVLPRFCSLRPLWLPGITPSLHMYVVQRWEDLTISVMAQVKLQARLEDGAASAPLGDAKPAVRLSRLAPPVYRRRRRCVYVTPVPVTRSGGRA
jgi:hypothetical protein